VRDFIIELDLNELSFIKFIKKTNKCTWICECDFIT